MIDTTAYEAIGWAEKSDQGHSPGCRTNGGSLTHGVRGYWCDRCAALNERYALPAPKDRALRCGSRLCCQPIGGRS